MWPWKQADGKGPIMLLIFWQHFRSYMSPSSNLTPGIIRPLLPLMLRAALVRVVCLPLWGGVSQDHRAAFPTLADRSLSHRLWLSHIKWPARPLVFSTALRSRPSQEATGKVTPPWRRQEP